MKSNPDPSEGTGSKVVGVEEGGVEGHTCTPGSGTGVPLERCRASHWCTRLGLHVFCCN